MSSSVREVIPVGWQQSAELLDIDGVLQGLSSIARSFAQSHGKRQCLVLVARGMAVGKRDERLTGTAGHLPVGVRSEGEGAEFRFINQAGGDPFSEQVIPYDQGAAATGSRSDLPVGVGVEAAPQRAPSRQVESDRKPARAPRVSPPGCWSRRPCRPSPEVPHARRVEVGDHLPKLVDVVRLEAPVGRSGKAPRSSTCVGEQKASSESHLKRSMTKLSPGAKGISEVLPAQFVEVRLRSRRVVVDRALRRLWPGCRMPRSPRVGQTADA